MVSQKLLLSISEVASSDAQDLPQTDRQLQIPFSYPIDTVALASQLLQKFNVCRSIRTNYTNMIPLSAGKLFIINIGSTNRTNVIDDV